MFNGSLIFIGEKIMLKIANLSEFYLFKKYGNKNIDFKRVNYQSFIQKITMK